MNFDKNAVKKLSQKEAAGILLKSGTPVYIIGSIILASSLLSLTGNCKVNSLIFIIPCILLIAFGFRKFLLNNERKEKFLTSKLLDQAIKSEKKKGNKLSKEEIEKIKFEYDPIFHDKVITGVHREKDNEYARNIRNAERKVKSLENSRKNEIRRIDDSRWQTVDGENLKYNLIEGKIRINKTEHLFSAIKGAEVNKQDSYRVITTNNTVTKEKGKSKKHISLSKALVGGVLLGPAGAIVGGAMGKTTTNGKTTTSGTSVSNSIPTCNHIGVVIDINGFKSEVVLLNRTVDQSSRVYITSLQRAEEIVSKLHFLATQPVPEAFIKVEEETSVLEYDKQIVEAQEELEKVKANKPTYDIPEKYLR